MKVGKTKNLKMNLKVLIILQGKLQLSLVLLIISVKFTMRNQEEPVSRLYLVDKNLQKKVLNFWFVFISVNKLRLEVINK